jgi:hypothetical protein
MDRRSLHVGDGRGGNSAAKTMIPVRQSLTPNSITFEAPPYSRRVCPPKRSRRPIAVHSTKPEQQISEMSRVPRMSKSIPIGGAQADIIAVVIIAEPDAEA